MTARCLFMYSLLRIVNVGLFQCWIQTIQFNQFRIRIRISIPLLCPNWESCLPQQPNDKILEEKKKKTRVRINNVIKKVTNRIDSHIHINMILYK